MPCFIGFSFWLTYPSTEDGVLNQLRRLLQQLFSRDFRVHQVQFGCVVVLLVVAFQGRFQVHRRIHGGQATPCTFGRCNQRRFLKAIRLRPPFGLMMVCLGSSFVYLSYVFVVLLGLATVVAEVMPPVTIAADSLEENFGQPLVLCDCRSKCLNVGFFR